MKTSSLLLICSLSKCAVPFVQGGGSVVGCLRISRGNPPLRSFVAGPDVPINSITVNRKTI